MLFILKLRYLFFGKLIIIIFFLSLFVYVFFWLVYNYYFLGEGGGGGYVRVWFRCLVICNILLGVKIYNYYLYKVLFL